jgi:putative sterol carrier protein
VTENITASEFEKIKRLVDETDPEELSAAVAAQYGGYGPALHQVFGLYQQTFDPERAEDESGTFQFVVGTPEGKVSYLITVAEGACRVEAGAATDPTVSIHVDLADFLRMSCGQTNGAMLAMTGKLECDGDVMAAMNLADWFVMPESDD